MTNDSINPCDYPGPEQTNWNFSVLYHFQGLKDGGAPFGGVVMDANGTLYGTAYSGGVNREGVVFKLTPPGPGHPTWTETVLHNFSYDWVYKIHDGANPVSRLIMDASGALYGTTIGGGATNQFGYGYGTVFKLTPLDPEKNNWTKTTLYSFSGSPDGGLPAGTLHLDATGAIYGTTYGGGTSGGGTVFKITPPGAAQTSWTESVLYSFAGPDGAGPQGGLIADESGRLYGTASGGGNYGFGVVFRLSPHPTMGQTAWSEEVLHYFNVTSGDNPFYGLVADPQGNLFGTAYYGGTDKVGTIFEVTP